MPDFVWRVSKSNAGMRLLQFLRQHCLDAPSVKAIKRAIEGKRCTVNNRTQVFSSFSLKENDVVALSSNAFEEPKKIHVSILHEDRDLLIINKPAGLISDAKLVKAHLPDPKGSLELVHRLDKETTGALILAKNSKAKEKMIALFKKRALRKLYLALVDGPVSQEEGTIDNYLGKITSYEGQTIYGPVDPKRGQRAITHWRRLKQGRQASLVAAEPYTGRTHQLRVHFSGLGHPILGDVQYGKKFHCPYKPERNLLHAYSLAFMHPTSRKEIKVVAPIPPDFKRALEWLKLKSLPE